ncbi:MAG: putative Na+/H+ antiporter [Verrucomicrobiota bacterium]
MPSAYFRAFCALLFCLLAAAVDAGEAGGHHGGEDLTPFPLPLQEFMAHEKEIALERYGPPLESLTDDSAPGEVPGDLASPDHAAEVPAGPASRLGLWQTLAARVQYAPIHLVVTIIFFGAILHTFFAGKFMAMAHRIEHEHGYQVRGHGKKYVEDKDPVSFKATLFHFLGEVEVIFGIWIVPLFLVVTFWPGYGWDTIVYYIDIQDYTEPVFVVIIMAIASSRPILQIAQSALSLVAALGKHSTAAWWLSILTIAPMLGSFITEPAAMTIAALLLGQQFYKYKPTPRFAYATMGLLFVNISVGGTLTHFAAPPVLMVAGGWGWDMGFMFTHFGWRAAMGILISNAIYFYVFRKNFAALAAVRRELEREQTTDQEEEPTPVWIRVVHLGFIAWTVLMLHDPPMFVGGFLVFLAFTMATAHHQYQIQLKGPILVGFFLAALKIHGGLQGWWIAPVLGSLTEIPLFLISTLLTAFNDNAAITFLASQVPDFSQYAIGTSTLKAGQELARAEMLEYAVVAGAVTGGGLTVIANAPNPAGQSILSRFFSGGISPLGLFLGALLPTVIQAIVFIALPH